MNKHKHENEWKLARFICLGRVHVSGYKEIIKIL